jgi:hypothetical protein
MFGSGVTDLRELTIKFEDQRAAKDPTVKSKDYVEMRRQEALAKARAFKSQENAETRRPRR